MADDTQRERWRPTAAWMLDRARNHLERMRREGAVRVVSADASRLSALLRRYRWRATHDMRPNAVPAFVIGVQRSGTDMLIMSFKECPEVEVHNEAEDTRAFRNFALRDDRTIRSLVESSRHRVVMFKSLLDVHRIDHLLTELGTSSHGRAVWIYRSMEGRVRSTLAVWPENNHRVLSEIAAGREDAHWESNGLSDEHLALVRSFDYAQMTAESAAALLWYLRNSLFFDLELDRRRDVALASYERILENPDRHVRLLSEFLGVRYNPRMTKDIKPRPPALADSLEIDERVRSLCEGLYVRLEQELDERLHSDELAGGGTG